MQNRAIAFAEHLATLLEFHHDDDRAEQFVDPVEGWTVDPKTPAMLCLRLASGRELYVHVIEPTELAAPFAEARR